MAICHFTSAQELEYFMQQWPRRREGGGGESLANDIEVKVSGEYDQRLFQLTGMYWTAHP